ncbi:MAG: hypothetical protein SPE00_03095 [Bacilli bacterium]|nr:hypothetical protein [Bacilli bacterium]
MILTILDDVAETFWKIIISLVGSIFKLVNSAYRIFLALAEADIFENAEFDIITKNMYEILSIVMLFALAYGILVKIVDPENSKSGVDGKKILQKLVMAIVLLALIPSIFSFMFGLQEAILESNVLNSIFTGSSNVGAQNIQNAGNVMAVNSFKPFFTPNVNSDVNPEDARGIIKNHTEYGVTLDNQESYGCKYKECTLSEVDSFAEKTGDFGFYQAFAANINEGEVDFQWLIALVVGGFLVYAMISFCFDMALRVCKLAFFEIIAPIAIFCNVIPKMEDVFKKWLSNTTKTFISVFTRIIVMNFGVYLISIIVKNVDLGLDNPGNWFLNLIAKCFLILGIVMFMRQAPKLLSDLFGFGDGDMKLGIKDKLKSSGAFAAGAAIGAGTTGLVRNTVHGVQNVRDAKGFKDKSKAILKLGGSAVAGTASGFTKGAWYAKGADSGKDMKNAASQAANKTVENRNKREAYKAAHPGFMGTTLGHFEDVGDSALKWAGFNNIEALQKANAEMSKVSSKKKAMADAAESLIVGEANKNKSKDFGIDPSVQFDGGADLLAQQYNGQFNTSTVRIIRQKLDEAKATGSSKDNYGVDVSAAEWENLYGSYLNSFKEAVQNQALLSKNNWDAIANSAVKADLSEVRNAANDFRNELGRHLNESFVVKSNALSTGSKISAETLEEDIKINDGAFKEIGDQIKIAQSENYAQISKIQQKEQEKNGK